MKRGKERLIPFEESRRVIRLDRRGKQRNKRLSAAIAAVLLGAGCLLYCAAIAVMGFGTRFFLIWGVLGLLFIGAGILLQSALMTRISVGIKRAAAVLSAVLFLIFILVEGLIFSGFGSQAAPGAAYCIVLGAQWKADGPGEALRRRLDYATEYLKASPETVVIVSGGQGADEPISEAAGMKQYLCDAGISKERILMEDRSGNTRENLAFSAELIDGADGRVVIVTNNFHVFRAVWLAKQQGYHAEGLAASSVTWMLPNNMLREFFGVIKDFVVEMLP